MARPGFQFLDLCVDGGVAIKEIVKFQKIGFECHDLLHPHRPLLIPRAGQAERFVPSRQLNGAGAGLFRQCDREHFDQNAIDVVFRLLFRQAKRIDLHPVPETAEFRIFDTIPLLADLVPQIDEGAHLAHLGDKSNAGVDEE